MIPIAKTIKTLFIFYPPRQKKLFLPQTLKHLTTKFLKISKNTKNIYCKIHA